MHAATKCPLSLSIALEKKYKLNLCGDGGISAKLHISFLGCKTFKRQQQQMSRQLAQLCGSDQRRRSFDGRMRGRLGGRRYRTTRLAPATAAAAALTQSLAVVSRRGHSAALVILVSSDHRTDQ